MDWDRLSGSGWPIISGDSYLLEGSEGSKSSVIVARVVSIPQGNEAIVRVINL